MKKDQSKISIRSLAKEFGLDRATITKLCEGTAGGTEARAAITAWCAKRQTKSLDRDPETGLSWWQARLREDVLKSRASRDREQQLSGGELIPAGLVEVAAKQVFGCFDKLANAMYLHGVPLDSAGRAVVERLAHEASADFKNYIRQTLDRQVEIRAEQNDYEAP
jgi:plasmid maintenance system antidote protein VapI